MSRARLTDYHKSPCRAKGCGTTLQVFLGRRIKALSRDLLVLHVGIIHSVLLHGHVAPLRRTVVEEHLFHQNFQLVYLLPRLDDEVAGVTGHRHVHIHVLPRLG